MLCVLLFTNRECSQKRRRTCSSSDFSAPWAVIITAGCSVTTLARQLYQDICIFDWHACTLFCWFDYWLIGSALRLHIIHDTEHNFLSERHKSLTSADVVVLLCCCVRGYQADTTAPGRLITIFVSAVIMRIPLNAGSWQSAYLRNEVMWSTCQDTTSLLAS